ncbi:hypothetical protein CGLO_15158 [Colletotrichum gloeosporioides Cg-14]|uniref:Uncharacterized protein n=1 Tax=Colletotrichum gloeosporioides (strain Cg-14) TaxID=1237896 RepID=T0JZC4_COLGC|nr:hypothetical protein CGLO_15158 [Colletotrichum gloeosporioides Cg-14]
MSDVGSASGPAPAEPCENLLENQIGREQGIEATFGLELAPLLRARSLSSAKRTVSFEADAETLAVDWQATKRCPARWDPGPRKSPGYKSSVCDAVI